LLKLAAADSASPKGIERTTSLVQDNCETLQQSAEDLQAPKRAKKRLGGLGQYGKYLFCISQG
jgi:hypothetical protein